MKKPKFSPDHFVTALGTCFFCIAAIGAIGFWLVNTTFATNEKVESIDRKYHKVADTMEKTYIKEIAEIKQVQAVTNEKIKAISENVKDVKASNKEILFIIRKKNGY